MPQIKPYEAPALGLRPTETGINATAQAARRVQGEYNEAAAAKTDMGQRVATTVRDAGEIALKATEHFEISRGAKTLAETQNRISKQWDETVKNADPNDPTVGQRFIDQVNPDLDKLKDGFFTERGQQFAEHTVDQFRQHLFQKTSADMATMAGEAAKLNHRQTVNSLASAAYRDPSSLDYSLSTLESSTHAVVDSSPNLTGTAAAKVKGELLQQGKEAIVKSAVMGMIERNPNVDLSAVEKKYGDYISGPEMRQFAKAAQSQAKTDALRQKQLDIYQKQQDTQAFHGALAKNMVDNVSIDPATNRPVIKPDYFKNLLQAAKMPNADVAAVRTGLDWGEHQQNLKDSAIRSDPAMKQDFIDRMFSTDKPTTEIELMRAQVNGKLSKDDFSAMHHMVKTLEESPMKGPIWKDTMDAVKSELVLNIPGLPGKDTVGVGNYAKFAQTFIPQYQAAARAGTLQPNALDIKDPESMISKAMAPFIRSQKDRLLDYTRAAGGINFGGEVSDQGAPVVLPPVGERKAGQVYPTARGRMKWTGTGWVTP